jgi:hypothetical protein
MARKKSNIHYIYKTTCNVTGRWYVGMHSTSNIEDGYMGSGTMLRHSIRKYGVENHTKEILEYLPNREKLILREKEIVNKELIGDGKCMNLKEGGSGGFSNKEHMLKCSNAGNLRLKELRKTDLLFVETQRKKQSENQILRLKTNPEKYKNFKSDWNGKKHKESSKKLIGKKNSIKQKGKNNSQYGTCWITNDVENKKISKDDKIPNGWRLGRKIK